MKVLMSCKFSCFLSFTDSLKENDVGVFHSDNGDFYAVKYRSNVCRDLLLTIEWRTPKQILVTVKLYNTTFKRCFSSRGLVVNGRKTFMKLRGAFNVSSSQNYKVLCVINLIPYITFNACNNIASQSFDSEYLEPNIQQSLIEEYNDLNDKKNCRGESIEERSDVSNITNIEKNEIAQSKFESSESMMETEHNLQSEEKDIALDRAPCKDDISFQDINRITSENIISDTNEILMSVALKSNDSLCDQNDIKSNGNGTLESEGYFKSEEILVKTDSSLKNNFIASNKGAVIDKSDLKINEFVSSDDMPIVTDECTESEKQDLLLNSSTLNKDFSKKVMTKNVDDVYDNLNILDVKKKKKGKMDEEKSLEIKDNFSKLSSERSSSSSDEENLTVKKVPKIKEIFISSNNSSNFNTKIKNMPALISNTNEPYINNKSETIIDTSNLEDSIPLESYCINENSSNILGNNLTSYNIAPFTEDQESLKINEDKQLLTVRSESPQKNYLETPNEVKESEINSGVVDCSKSISPKLPSSKTDFVFQTLARKLSVDDSDHALNINGEAGGNSETIFKNSPESKLVKAKNLPVMESELKGLSMDMLDLLTSGDMADAEIINGEKSIKVHRAIISARSSVLKQMFMEQEEDDIKYCATVDIPSYILEDIVIFLYVGLVYIKNSKMAHDLHEVAERYRINDLIDVCSKHISD